MSFRTYTHTHWWKNKFISGARQKWPETMYGNILLDFMLWLRIMQASWHESWNLACNRWLEFEEVNARANLPNRGKNGNVLRTNRQHVKEGEKLCLHERMSERDGWNASESDGELIQLNSTQISNERWTLMPIDVKPRAHGEITARRPNNNSNNTKLWIYFSNIIL